MQEQAAPILTKYINQSNEVQKNPDVNVESSKYNQTRNQIDTSKGQLNQPSKENQVDNISINSLQDRAKQMGISRDNIGQNCSG